MEVFIKVVQLILSLSLLVFVHELGHYLAARMFGIRVEKFYLFFDAGGFSLLKFKVGDTTFGLGWVPFGGYCKIAGMIDESMDTEAMAQPPQPYEFRSKPAWQRLIVIVSGVVMNVVAACVIFIGMSWHWGDTYIDNEDVRWGWQFNELAKEIGFRDGDRFVSFDGEPVTGNINKIPADMVIGQVETVTVERAGEMVDVAIPAEYISEMLNSADLMIPRVPFVIGAVAEGGSAERSGMAAGDSLVAFNGVPMSFFDEYREALAAAKGQTVEITAVRDSAGVKGERTFNVTISEEGLLGVGVVSATEYLTIHTVDYNLWQAIPAGFRRTGREIAGYWQQLKLVVSPKTEAYKQVGSLIAIGNFFPSEWDWFRFWNLTGFLSIILAIMNILPIPVLDGGYVVFLLWEVVTGRKPSDRVMQVALNVGMLMLVALLVLAFGNDIYRFFIK
ncbi:MAG: RIP metalloprotease RseP [Rikenellaceae bacterium]|jgi:regulator of sigma E protease|nr:RIP metalloprotease RseP [Rikenellaceae bacterium]